MDLTGYRIDGHHGQEGARRCSRPSPTSAPTPTSTSARSDGSRPRKPNGSAVRKPSGENLEAQWARAEWFDTREREIEDLVRLWDEAATADER